MKPRKPNFLIVGVQKAGTTFLANHLADHPDVFFAEPKELFFFNDKTISRDQFMVYRYENFSQAGDKLWVGEGSTNYFHHSHAINHIEHYLGNGLRVIVCLRHPVERLFSHYLHDYRKSRLTGGEPLGDSKWSGYYSRSFYHDRLVAWGGQFRRLRVMFFDDLVASGVNYYGNAAAFLGIEPQPISDLPVNEGLRMVWEGDELTISAAPGPGQVAPRFRREDVESLLALFADDVRRTGDFAHRDLSRWLRMPEFGQLDAKFATVDPAARRRSRIQPAE